MNGADLLRDVDLMARFGLSRATFYRLKSAGKFHRFRTKQPMANRIYSKALVDQFCAGGSTVQFGRRTA